MAENSKIEWTDHTANLWWGCTEVHAGCDNCYAKAWAKRYQPTDLWETNGVRMAIQGVWKELEKYQRRAAERGEMDSVFVGSMMDIAEKCMKVIARTGEPEMVWPGRQMTTDDLRWKFFHNVVPATPNLLYLFLSKRPGNYNKVVPIHWRDEPPKNVMFGCSVVSPATLRLVDQLREVNGYRFLSIEPQLEYIPEIDLTGIDWVIVGGESGPKRRPFNADWGRRLRDICAEQNVPFFFKQMDKMQSIPDDLMIREFPVLQYMAACN